MVTGAVADEPTSNAEQTPVSPLAVTKKQAVIQVAGVKDALYDNVLAHLALNAAAQKSAPLSASEFRRLSKNAEQEVEAALQAFGYYQATIVVQRADEARWRLGINVQPGEPATLRDVQLGIVGGGRDAPELIAVQSHSAMRVGDVLSHQAYENYKSNLRRTAFAIGYLDAEFLSHELRVYPQHNVADIVLQFDTGKRYFFGPISVQQDILNNDFVERFVKPQTGDPFESSRLVQLQLALSDTNYFSHVGVDVQRDSVQDHHIPIVIDASARKAAKYDFSVGFGTDTGPRVGIGADFRRVNRRGHRFKSQLQVSTVAASLASQYLIPIGDVSSEFWDFSANVEQETVNEVDVTEYRIGSSLNQNRWGGRRRLALDLVHENWSFGEQPSQNATLLIPSIDFTMKNADDPFFVRRGYSGTVRLLGGVENLLSDISFAQIQVFGKAVYSLHERSRLLLRGELGATTVDDFDQLPPSLRFFTGGSQSVRGYGYKDLSPTNGAGDRIGGKYLAVVSAEVDYLIYNNIGLAAFVDAGDATREPLQRLKIGAGLGLRYKSPVGMLRFDIAHPFDDPDESFRVHLSFGIDL